MTELKTLKDLEEEDVSLSSWTVSSIRAEAIKWVKGLNHAWNLGEDYVVEEHYTINEHIEIKTVVEWIIHFFNLTEEDLK